MAYPIPLNETERVREVRQLSFRKWHGSAALDQLCATASHLLGMSLAAVSLIEAKNVYFVGKFGIAADRAPREVALCAHTILYPEPMIVEDAENDARFAEHPAVRGTPKVRSYLGIPLEMPSGLRVGTFCLASPHPRKFNPDNVQTLTELSRIAVSIIRAQRAQLELKEQMSAAVAVQNGMLPDEAKIKQIASKFPLELCSHYVPRNGVSGDIWGIEALSDGRVLIFLADFTGHGLAAALNTVRFHALAGMVLPRVRSAGAFLSQINQRLCAPLPPDQFATAFCAIMDFKAQTLEFASAGSPPQLFRLSGDHPFETIGEPGLPLGLFRNAHYQSRQLPFLPGGQLCLYSDALIETPPPPASIFTASSLREFLNESPLPGTPSETAQKILLELFTKTASKVDDDMTLVIARNNARGNLLSRQKIAAIRSTGPAQPLQGW